MEEKKGFIQRMKNIKNFKKGVKELTPEQIIQSKIIGTVGTIVGMMMGAGVLLYYLITDFTWLNLSFEIAILFGVFLSYIQYKEVKKQKDSMINLSKLQQELIEKTKGDDNAR